MKPLRVLVCGGRAYSDAAFLTYFLDQLHALTPIGLVIHGKAPGADTLADMWARKRGISVHAFAAQWEKFGKRAGPIRNQAMLDKGQPDLVVAFPGGVGTADMMARAKAAGVRVREAHL